MIGYHWSPIERRNSILKHGLLIPLKHPKLVEPVVCSEGHRNPHISVGRNPQVAWELSGGFLHRRAIEEHASFVWRKIIWWDLWQVNLLGVKYKSNWDELQIKQDVPRSKVFLIAKAGKRITDK